MNTKTDKAKTEKPFNPAFPPPADGSYEVQWRDKVVKAKHASGRWKLPDGRAIDIKGWRK